MRLARWVEETRAELTRVEAELRSLPSGLASSRSTAEVPTRRQALASSSITPMVKIMLDAAMERLDAEAAAARDEAEAVVTAAMQKATALLRSVGADRSTIERATTPVGPALTSRPAPARPEPLPSVVDPWRDLSTGDPGRELDFGVLDLGVLDLVDDRRNPAQVYAAFWGEALVDRPVRERVRRWMQGQAS